MAGSMQAFFLSVINTIHAYRQVSTPKFTFCSQYSIDIQDRQFYCSYKILNKNINIRGRLWNY